MSNWIDLSVLEHSLNWIDPDLWQILGIDPSYVQFFLVFIFMMSLMWVVRPVVEWIMLKNWTTISTYVTTTLIAFCFLQMVDRYAMIQNESSLPVYFWPVCLLAISGYGALHVLVVVTRNLWIRISKRTKRKAA
ncbi:hypothetical protein LCM20_02535 [Halobacillus litoralis]|uniref:hypothetical protein n=1 Tax=Halobacillus litoralis TaxID=45668 RepID=UPI001CD78A5E|nr:hypothetical protein [Halobacillus litoralis]MCA0969467.1 hypothetical protein [Halobacillus litoralis]